MDEQASQPLLDDEVLQISDDEVLELPEDEDIVEASANNFKELVYQRKTISNGISSDAIVELRRIFENCSDDVDRHLEESEMVKTLQSLSEDFVKQGVDEEKLDRIKKRLAELSHSVQGHTFAPSGSLAEIWTFNSLSDIVISFAAPYGSFFSLCAAENSPGLLEVHTAEKCKSKPLITPSSLLVLCLLFTTVLSILEASVYFLVLLPSMCVNETVKGSSLVESLETNWCSLFMLSGTALILVLIPLESVIATYFMQRMFKSNIMLNASCFYKCLLPKLWRFCPPFTPSKICLNLNNQSVKMRVSWEAMIAVTNNQWEGRSEWMSRHAARFPHTHPSVFSNRTLAMSPASSSAEVWSLNFSNVEKPWLQGLTSCQGVCLTLTTFAAQNNGLLPLLKHAFYWTLFFQPEASWSEENICRNALKSLCFLKRCCSYGCLPNYFNIKDNILKTHKDVAPIPDIKSNVFFLTSCGSYFRRSVLMSSLEAVYVLLCNWNSATGSLVPGLRRTMWSFLDIHRAFMWQKLRASSWVYAWINLGALLLSLGVLTVAVVTRFTVWLPAFALTVPFVLGKVNGNMFCLAFSSFAFRLSNMRLPSRGIGF